MPERGMPWSVRIAVAAVGAVVLLGIGGYFTWKNMSAESEPQTQVVEQPTTPEPPPLSAYSSSTMGVAANYPREFSVNETYFYDKFAKKPINGVKFVIPMTMATGTNLSADSGVSIEQLPRAKTCTGDIYLLANVKAQKVTEGGIAYSIATSSEGAAGNLYEEMVYAVASSSPCTAVRYLIHSTNLGNYPPGAVSPFDRAALLQEFDKIRTSLSF